MSMHTYLSAASLQAYVTHLSNTTREGSDPHAGLRRRFTSTQWGLWCNFYPLLGLWPGLTLTKVIFISPLALLWEQWVA